MTGSLSGFVISASGARDIRLFGALNDRARSVRPDVPLRA